MRLDAQYTHTARSMTRSVARELMGAAILMGNALIIERRRLASARASSRPEARGRRIERRYRVQRAIGGFVMPVTFCNSGILSD